MKTVATGLDEDTARHWENVLTDSGITPTVEARDGTFEVLVPDGDYETAQQLFADPFGDEAPADGPTLPPVAPRPLDPGDTTELLARTADVFAAQRLAGILDAAGLYTRVDQDAVSNTFGVDGLPAATVWFATKEKDKAFAVLETFAREHTDVFQGAPNLSPSDVAQALLDAIQGKVVFR